MQDPAFTPARALAGPHAQTLWAALIRPAPRLPLRYEGLELPDGDFLRLAWGPARNGPLVVILHGLTGSARSRYVARLLHAVTERGWQGVVMQARGSDGDNRLDRFQHGGAIDDIAHTVATLRQRFPDRALSAVGYSIGGSVLLNALGRGGLAVDSAATVSVPFDLAACARALNRGFAKVYQCDLMRGLRRMLLRRLAHHPRPFIAPSELRAIRTLWDFDERLTAPLHGFAGAADYYRRASCGQHLAAIERPTLVLQARDDPFVPAHCLPCTGSPMLRLELTRGGGHVGFVARDQPGWLEQRLLRHIDTHLHYRTL